MLILFVLFIASTAYGSPYLVCDPQTDTDSYIIYSVAGATCTADDVSGKTPVETPYPLHYDLAGLPLGAFRFCIAAKNVWGQSILVPFGSTKVVPGTPANIKLSSH